MKWRVALTATLLNLLVCALLLFAGSYSAAKLQNEGIKEELRVTCRLSAETLDSAAFVDKLTDIAVEGAMLSAYIEADGTVAMAEEGFSLSLLEEAKKHGDTAVYVGVWSDEDFPHPHNVANEYANLCYAVMRTDSGGKVVYSKLSVTFWELIGAYLWRVLPIMFVSLLAQMVIILRYVGRADRLLKQFMGVLEDFTEGRFSSRISGVSGFSPEDTAQYNATLARVQDRVFRQVRRNRVVGQMLNQMHNGIVTVDTNLAISFVTSNAGRLFGKDIKEAEGRSLHSVFDNEELEKNVTQAISSGSANVFTAETEAIMPNGAISPLRLYTSTMFAEGKCTGALTVIEDISEIRKLEQIRTDFAANVSHEMKTPLTSLKGFIETLQSGAVDDPKTARRFLDIMMVEAERLTRLINDILSITKLESGNDSVEIQRLNLLDIVNYVSGPLLSPQADAKQVTITVNNPDVPAYIMGNRDRVQQLVLNLIENAVKYNKIGGTVTVNVVQDSENVNLIVADTGIGIKEEHLGRLFERFYRVDKGRSREMGGTGLGLAICKHIVNTMDGYIEVNSKYGVGTEFLVTLKKAPPEEVVQQEEE
ncbi:MAG: PAS domain S-box protein [Clostridia bacterium]|nr:PAS domain S-box protein [Clostridia bacterium]